MLVIGIIGYALSVMAVILTVLAIRTEMKTASHLSVLVAWSIHQGVCVWPESKSECQLHDCRNCWIVHSGACPHKVDELLIRFKDSANSLVSEWEKNE